MGGYESLFPKNNSNFDWILMLFFLKKLIVSLVVPPVSLLVIAAGGLLLQRWRPRAGLVIVAISLLSITAISDLFLYTV